MTPEQLAAVERLAKLETLTFSLSDLGNAERLVAAHCRDIRYVPGLGWIAWDGRRWARDDTGALLRLAKRTARAILHDAGNCEDDDERKRILAWARTSEFEPRLKAMVSLAASEEAVVERANQLDADPWLLNVQNGTIDLKTGELRAHDPANLSTKLAAVEYDPNARSERWERFLDRITDNDTELCGFIQRVAGYTIAGVTDEEILAFLHGPGATGKTTFIEAIKAALGEFASTSDFTTFLARRGDAGIRNDVARLAGARMVVSAEVEDGKRLAEGLIKQITGGDTVVSRFLHREHFEFEPHFTLWLVANARPRAQASDDALWRRILQIPFVVVIPPEERDPELKRALRIPEEQTAVLAWLVQGCLQWQERGLDVPDRVRDYTNEYRAENDPLAEWIADHCHINPKAWTATSELRASYERWREETAARHLDNKAFAAGLKDHGCTDGKQGGKRGWHGIAIQTGQLDG